MTDTALRTIGITGLLVPTIGMHFAAGGYGWPAIIGSIALGMTMTLSCQWLLARSEFMKAKDLKRDGV